MANKDGALLEVITGEFIPFIKQYEKEPNDEAMIEHPLDEDVFNILKTINIKENDNEYAIFEYSKEINSLWKLIIEKSIKCLRYFDEREPFRNNKNKKPVAYGVSDLGDYFDKYTDFESALYGGVKYYRDHVVHVFRTWMLGLKCLLENDGAYLNRIHIGKGINVNPLEKISIWSMIALTHDLGYPLEKAWEIIGKTKDMMKTFLLNPIVQTDLSFNGVQNNMNDFVLRFLSSKMHIRDEAQKTYVARLQPKYYFKFQKSLEKSMHGIISSIIIYKLLIYFLESDYNINEDYVFYEEDMRQFYIRREILRSIASHTSYDIYHLDMLTFSFLLIVVDDCQGWGRKNISDLYVNPSITYEFKDIRPIFETKTVQIDGESVDIHKCEVSDEYKVTKKDIAGLKRLLKNIKNESDKYKVIFRDGQDTAKRNFTFIKSCKVTYQERYYKIEFDIEFTISNEVKSEFKVKINRTTSAKTNNKFGIDFLKDVFDNLEVINVNENDDYIEFIIEERQTCTAASNF